MKIELIKKANRYSIMFDYLTMQLKGQEGCPRSKEDVAIIERTFIDRLCGFNPAKHNSLKMVIEAAFWSGIVFGKTHPDKIKIDMEKKGKETIFSINEKDYIG